MAKENAVEGTAEEIPPEVREYMSRLGRKRTPAKMEAIRANAAKGAAARRLDPAMVPCTCDGGDSVELKDHKTTCPRGRLLYQRARKEAAKAESEQKNGGKPKRTRATK